MNQFPCGPPQSKYLIAKNLPIENSESESKTNENISKIAEICKSEFLSFIEIFLRKFLNTKYVSLKKIIIALMLLSSFL